MTKTPPTAAEKLAARVASLSTARLVEMHGMVLDQMYAAAKESPAKAEYHSIVLDAIVTELEKPHREVAFTSCCYGPAGQHDERICDRNGPTKLTEAADVIMKGLDSVH